MLRVSVTKVVDLTLHDSTLPQSEKWYFCAKLSQKNNELRKLWGYRKEIGKLLSFWPKESYSSEEVDWLGTSNFWIHSCTDQESNEVWIKTNIATTSFYFNSHYRSCSESKHLHWGASFISVSSLREESKLCRAPPKVEDFYFSLQVIILYIWRSTKGEVGQLRTFPLPS